MKNTLSATLAIMSGSALFGLGVGHVSAEAATLNEPSQRENLESATKCAPVLLNHAVQVYSLPVECQGMSELFPLDSQTGKYQVMGYGAFISRARSFIDTEARSLSMKKSNLRFGVGALVTAVTFAFGIAKVSTKNEQTWSQRGKLKAVPSDSQ